MEVENHLEEKGHGPWAMPSTSMERMAVGQNCDTPWLTTEDAQNRLLGRSTYRGLRGPGFDPQSYVMVSAMSQHRRFGTERERERETEREREKRSEAVSIAAERSTRLFRHPWNTSTWTILSGCAGCTMETTPHYYPGSPAKTPRQDGPGILGPSSAGVAGPPSRGPYPQKPNCASGPGFSGWHEMVQVNISFFTLNNSSGVAASPAGLMGRLLHMIFPVNQVDAVGKSTWPSVHSLVCKLSNSLF